LLHLFEEKVWFWDDNRSTDQNDDEAAYLVESTMHSGGMSTENYRVRRLKLPIEKSKFKYGVKE